MTPAERSRVEWIAEKCMGLEPKPLNVHLGELPQGFYFWEGATLWATLIGDGARVRAFAPLASKSDAMAALEAWCDANHCDYSVSRHTQRWKPSHVVIFCVLIQENEERFEWCPEGKSATLPLAICEALCAATGYEDRPVVADSATSQEATHES